MTRDDIIRMAREAGLEHREAAEEFNSPYCDGVYLDDLERFAALVAAAEREACARACDFEVVRLTAIDEPRPALAVGICAATIRARSNT